MITFSLLLPLRTETDSTLESSSKVKEAFEAFDVCVLNFLEVAVVEDFLFRDSTEAIDFCLTMITLP